MAISRLPAPRSPVLRCGASTHATGTGVLFLFRLFADCLAFGFVRLFGRVFFSLFEREPKNTQLQHIRECVRLSKQ